MNDNYIDWVLEDMNFVGHNRFTLVRPWVGSPYIVKAKLNAEDHFHKTRKVFFCESGTEHSLNRKDLQSPGLCQYLFIHTYT